MANDKNKKASDEVNTLQRNLVLREQEVRDQQHHMKRPLEELDQLHKDHEDLLRENQDVKRKYVKIVILNKSGGLNEGETTFGICQKILSLL